MLPVQNTEFPFQIYTLLLWNLSLKNLHVNIYLQYGIQIFRNMISINAAIRLTFKKIGTMQCPFSPKKTEPVEFFCFFFFFHRNCSIMRMTYFPTYVILLNSMRYRSTICLSTFRGTNGLNKFFSFLLCVEFDPRCYLASRGIGRCYVVQ